MKFIPFVLPIAALIAGGVWLAGLATTQDSLARQNTQLRERILTAKTSTRSDDTPSPGKRRERARTVKPTAQHASEWTILAEGILRERSEGLEDPRMALRLATRLAGMSIEEILAAYDGIAASTMPLDELDFLRNQFFHAASGKAPDLTLRHFEGQLSSDDPSLRGALITAFRKWFGKNPAAATDWFDETIASGKFETKRLDGMSVELQDFSTPVIQAQLASDPAAALVRLKTLPEGRRLEILQKFGGIAPGTEQAFAELIRQGLPERQRDTAFLNATTPMAIEKGFAKVGEFLDTIEATAEERAGVAQNTACAALAQRTSRSDPANPKAVITEMREWLAQQAPNEAERISGTALATAVRSIGFEKAAALVAELHAESGSDELLAGFLDRAAMRSHPTETMAMANQIKDAALRRTVIDQLTSATGNGQ